MEIIKRETETLPNCLAQNIYDDGPHNFLEGIVHLGTLLRLATLGDQA